MVGLNFYPVSNRVCHWLGQKYGWLETYGKLLKWAAEGGTATWITGTPLNGSVTGGKSQEVKLSINSNNLAEGNYPEVRFDNDQNSSSLLKLIFPFVIIRHLLQLITIQQGRHSKKFTLKAVDPDGDSIRYIITNSPKTEK